jgi:hypothetical protein
LLPKYPAFAFLRYRVKRGLIRIDHHFVNRKFNL